MKVKVEKSFIDVHTKGLHQVGEVLDINEKRLEEIKSVDPSLVTVVSEEVKKKRTAKKGE